MIVRITNRSNRHYGHYGIVFKMSTDHGRHQILFLRDNEGDLCIKSGMAHSNDFEGIPQEEEREFDAWPPTLCDTNVHTTATSLFKLVEDGRKFRQIQSLINDK